MTEPASTEASEPTIIGRYALFDALASGGMATVHLGRLLGSVGFGRTVAVKRLHSHFTSDPDFVAMFMDEARIVSRIRHPNVVPMIDVIESAKGLFLVMEYVHGETLSRLMRLSRNAKTPIPIGLIAAVMHATLLGLHAAHETRGTNGELLDVVHRDVSPQNIIVGVDGIARVLDFGVAKAVGRAQVTREGEIKGKLAYMAPEQIRGKVDRRADVFAAAVVLWEALAGRRLHDGAKDVEIVSRVMDGRFERPSRFRGDIPSSLDQIVLRGLSVRPEDRFPDARAMALQIERAIPLSSPSEVGEWVESLASSALRARAARVEAMELASASLRPDDSVPPPSPQQDTSDHLATVPLLNGQFTPPPYMAPVAPTPRGTNPSGSVSARSSVSGRTSSGQELSNARREAPRRGGTAIVALVSFCVSLALVGIALAVFAFFHSSAPPAPALPPGPPRPPAVVAPPPAALTTVPAPATATAEPAAAPPAQGVSAAARTATPRSAVAAPGPQAAPSTASKNKDCEPPYSIDESGRRKYKPECLND